MPELFNRFFLSLLIVAHAVHPASAYEYAVPADQQQSYEETLKNLDGYVQFLRDLRKAIDRSQFDTNALIDKLNYELEPIVEFVTNDIAYEQYAGLLRGAQGTLIARSGNALDQSVLLATLLRDAGFEARVAFSKISHAQAVELLRQIEVGPIQIQPVGDAVEIERIIRVRAAKLGWSDEDIDAWVSGITESSEESHSAALSNFDTERTFLLDALNDAGISLDDADATAAIVEEATDYYWVQYRSGASGAWSDAHPSWQESSHGPGGGAIQCLCGECARRPASPSTIRGIYRTRNYG